MRLIGPATEGRLRPEAGAPGGAPPPRKEKATMSGNRPTAEVRLGRIKATIWSNRDKDGGRWHTVQLSRLYQDGEQWRSTHSFGRNDLLTVAKVADLAHSKVCELEASEREGEEAPAEDAEA